MDHLSSKKYHAATVTGEHVPNKEEAKELRRLMQKSGLTEEELRKHKVYRRKLADARKSSQLGTGKNAYRLLMRSLRKAAALELNVHINDPKVKKLANVKLQDLQGRSARRLRIKVERGLI
jgi:5-methylthioribose kinase